MRKYLIAFTLILFVLLNANLYACSAFILKRSGQNILCYNHDYFSSIGHFMINPRNVSKTAIPFPFETPAKWTSKYGSVTISVAREETMEGMNEAGLAIVTLALENNGEYPAPDNKPMVDNLQWVQYMLDNCATLEEVVAASQLIRISNQSPIPFHYMIADARGNYAIAAYINKELKFFLNDSRTGNFISNDCFATSMTHLKEYKGFGGKEALIEKYEEYSSKEAVVMGASMIKQFENNRKYDIEAYAFEIMEKVEAPKRTPMHKEYGTQWSMQYNVNSRQLSFKTMNNRTIRRIDLNQTNFTCSSGVKAFPVIEASNENIYTQFKDFTLEENKALLNRFVSEYLIEKRITPVVDEKLKEDIEYAAEFPFFNL